MRPNRRKWDTPTPFTRNQNFKNKQPHWTQVEEGEGSSIQQQGSSKQNQKSTQTWITDITLNNQPHKPI